MFDSVLLVAKQDQQVIGKICKGLTVILIFKTLLKNVHNFSWRLSFMIETVTFIMKRKA